MVGMQLPEKYKENFDISSEGPGEGSRLLQYFKKNENRYRKKNTDTVLYIDIFSRLYFA